MLQFGTYRNSSIETPLKKEIDHEELSVWDGFVKFIGLAILNETNGRANPLHV